MQELPCRLVTRRTCCGLRAVGRCFDPEWWVLLMEGRVGRESLSCRSSAVSREVSLARQVFEVFLLPP